MKFYKRSMLLFICFCLAACGFHAAEPLRLPQKRWFIASNEPYSPFIQQLRQTLLTLGNQIANTAEIKDALILEVLHEDTRKQLISVGATSQVSQYLFSYSIIFQVKDPLGRVVFPPTTITVERFNTINSNQILSDLDNFNQLQHDLNHDAIIKIITRLNAPFTQRALQHAYSP